MSSSKHLKVKRMTFLAMLKFRKLECFISHLLEVGDLNMEYMRGSYRKTLGNSVSKV